MGATNTLWIDINTSLTGEIRDDSEIFVDEIDLDFQKEKFPKCQKFQLEKFGVQLEKFGVFLS